MYLDFIRLPDWMLWFLHALVIGDYGLTAPQWLPVTFWM